MARAVAFLTLDRVQSTPEEARTAFLAGKGFTADEITEAKRQAAEVLKKRATSPSPSSSSTFGGAAAVAAPTPTTIKHILANAAAAGEGGEGKAFSKVVTLGGGSLSFVSLQSPADDGITTPDSLVRGLLSKLEETLQGSSRGKGDVAVLFFGVKNLVGYEEEIHGVLDEWVDAQAPPTRFLVEEAGKRHGAQLMAVVRG